MEARMKTSMRVTPWDRKALRLEVARIVRGIAGKKEPIYSLK
jgi:hypothetical protein